MNIKTQTIQVEGKTGSNWAGQQAQIGGIEGLSDNGAKTYRLGMRTENAGLIFQTANEPIAVRTGNNIFLEGGYTSSELNGQISISKKSVIDLRSTGDININSSRNLTVTATGGITISAATLTCNVPATAQFGIYARFA